MVLSTVISQYQRYCLFGHEHIDGDCVWSMLALGDVLTAMGKEVSYHTTIKPSSYFDFIPAVNRISNTFDYPSGDVCLIFLDFTPYSRIKWFTAHREEYFDDHFKLVIDHHPDSRERWNCEIKDTTASSNCEWLYQLLSEDELLDKYITPAVATYLLMWLSTDTGNGLYEKDPLRCASVQLALIQRGADKKKLMTWLYRSIPYEVFPFTSMVWSRIIRDGDLLYTYYDESELADYNLEKSQADALLWLVANVQWNVVLLIIRSVWDIIKWSMRSKSWQDSLIDVSMICRALFGWGWHVHASGFTTDRNYAIDMSDQVADIVNQIKLFRSAL